MGKKLMLQIHLMVIINLPLTSNKYTSYIFLLNNILYILHFSENILNILINIYSHNFDLLKMYQDTNA